MFYELEPLNLILRAYAAPQLGLNVCTSNRPIKRGSREEIAFGDVQRRHDETLRLHVPEGTI